MLIVVIGSIWNDMKKIADLLKPTKEVNTYSIPLEKEICFQANSKMNNGLFTWLSHHKYARLLFLLLTFLVMSGFGPCKHSEITKEAIEQELRDKGINVEDLSRECFEIIIDANKRQDQIKDFFSNPYPEYHFDSNNIEQGILYINQQWDIIRINEGVDCEEVLKAYGRLLHTIQDFYSHSNWVELYAPTVRSPDEIPLLDGDIQDLIPTPRGPHNEQIRSGIFKSNINDIFSKDPRSHRRMNKDSESSEAGKRKYRFPDGSVKTGYELALHLAIKHTQLMFVTFMGTAPQCFKKCFFCER